MAMNAIMMLATISVLGLTLMMARSMNDEKANKKLDAIINNAKSKAIIAGVVLVHAWAFSIELFSSDPVSRLAIAKMIAVAFSMLLCTVFIMLTSSLRIVTAMLKIQKDIAKIAIDCKNKEGGK